MLTLSCVQVGSRYFDPSWACMKMYMASSMYPRKIHRTVVVTSWSFYFFREPRTSFHFSFYTTHPPIHSYTRSHISHTRMSVSASSRAMRCALEWTSGMTPCLKEAPCWPACFSFSFSEHDLTRSLFSLIGSHPSPKAFASGMYGTSWSSKTQLVPLESLLQTT